jgi:phage terminase small subunit
MSPLSSDPVARQAQLANLQPGAETAPLGNDRARSHGGYARLAAERVDEKVREVWDALAADAPLRDFDDKLPAHDSAIVDLLAQTLCRLEDVTANIRDYGVFQARGKHKGTVRPAVELESKLRREAAGYLDSLGMTPKSRAGLGLDLARTRDLAQEWARQGDDEPQGDDERPALPPGEQGGGEDG